MKASKYNHFFKYEDLNIGFNAFTQEFIILEDTLLEICNVGTSKKDFSELEEIHAEFYNFLIDKGFLVDSCLDEFEKIKQISSSIDNDNSSYSLTINPTMNCNFKCWYCYETHVKDSKMDEITIQSTINFIKNIVAQNTNLKHFKVSFFGGEPLLYFNKVIVPILKSASKICIDNNINFQCGMTTNGLLINQEMLTVCKQYNLNGFQITLDGNKEQHDKVRYISEGKGSYEKIVANIKLAVRNNFSVNTRINCTADTLQSIPEIINEFNDLTEDERRYINFDIQKVWQVEENIEQKMTDSRELFRENKFPITGGIYDTVLNSCYADKRNHATINYNGDVFKCTARDFKSEEKEGQLYADGKIIWNDKHEKRLNSKFNNPPCKECKILPLCGGGCSQQALEHEGVDYCVHNFDEDEKNQVIFDKFLATLEYLSLQEIL